MNLFKSAETKNPVKKTSVKEEVIMSSDMFDGTAAKKVKQAEEFANKIQEMIALQEEIAGLEARMKPLEEEIKEIGKAQFLRLISKLKKRVTSFVLRSVDVKNSEAPSKAKLFIVQDRYKKIDEERFNYLAETYGEDLVERNVTYQMDTSLVEKYGEVISNLIVKCPEISDADKPQLIKAVVEFKVKKGAIEMLPEHDEAETLFEELQPVYNLKDTK